MKSSLTAICLTLVLSLGTVSTAWSADFHKGKDAYDKGDYATALREWRPFAEQGDARAQTLLGTMFHRGEDVPQDYNTAHKWLSFDAEQGTVALTNAG